MIYGDSKVSLTFIVTVSKQPQEVKAIWCHFVHKSVPRCSSCPAEQRVWSNKRDNPLENDRICIYIKIKLLSKVRQKICKKICLHPDLLQLDLKLF